MKAIYPKNQEELDLCKNILEFNDVILHPGDCMNVFKPDCVISVDEDKITGKYRKRKKITITDTKTGKKREKYEDIVSFIQFCQMSGARYFLNKISVLKFDNKHLEGRLTKSEEANELLEERDGSAKSLAAFFAILSLVLFVLLAASLII